MTKYYLLLLFLFVFTKPKAQQQELTLTGQQLEELFLANNLELMAEKYNIAMADAAIVQARLWNNPTFSINDLNFWSSNSKREGENIPPLFGSFGRNMQFSAELSQLVNLSGRRAKLIRIEKTSREISIQQFEEMLRALRLELRKLVNTILYHQENIKVLTIEHEILTGLLKSLEKQHSIGDLSTVELTRFKLALIELANELTEAQIELNNQSTYIKNLIADNSILKLTIIPDENKTLPWPDAMVLTHLIDEALRSRTDLNIERLQSEHKERYLKYEKTMRIPDLNLSVGYDRRGGVWPDFVGVGIGMDLPLFNRNQGNIKSAKAALEQSTYYVKQKEVVIVNEVTEAYLNYSKLHELSVQNCSQIEPENLDEIMTSYNKNFISKNISFVAYMDFMESYKRVKQMANGNRRDLYNQFEELKYITGIELIN